jgi:hypothetical protein
MSERERASEHPQDQHVMSEREHISDHPQEQVPVYNPGMLSTTNLINASVDQEHRHY